MLESFMDHISDGVAIVDGEGVVLDANRAFAARRGCAKEALIGRPLPADLSRLAAEVRRFAAQGDRAATDVCLPADDGAGRFASFTLSPVGGGRDALGAVAVVERAACEAEAGMRLHETENLYKTLVRNVNAGVYMVQDDKVVYANPYLVDMLGYSEDELLRIDSLDELLGPRWREKTGDLRALRADSEDKLQLAIEGRRKDGTMISMEATASRIIYRGRPACYGTVHDVTFKKQAEKQWREGAQRYQRIIKFLPEPIILSDEGTILYVNKSAMRLVKTDDENALIGKSLFDFLHPDSHERNRKVLRELLETDDSSGFEEHKLIRFDGEVIDVEMSSIQIYDYFGKSVILSVLRDLTERKLSEEIAVRSEKLSVIGQLAAGVAHEIRNPLTSLKGFTQLLKSKYGDQSRYFDIMAGELERINLIVNEFMTLAKPHYTKYGDRRLSDILRSVIPIIETQAIMNNVDIVVEIEDAGPIIHCDENQLKQVFINVLKNGIEAMPRGGQLTLRQGKPGPGQVSVMIQDQGVGIPASVIDKLGEPFFTTKEKGTGLGLMISSRIIQDHKGVFSVTSVENEGTTVQITLPTVESGEE